MTVPTQADPIASPPRRSLFSRLDRRSDDQGAIHRAVTASELVIAIVGIGGIVFGGMAALGFRSTSPGKSIEAVAARVDSNHESETFRIDTTTAAIRLLSRRVDSLSEWARLSAYMQCVDFRTRAPELLPPDCLPIVQARRSK
jgi:hypothetical protein